MASKIINPWRSLRSLAIRTRPRQVRVMPVHMARRGLSGDTYGYPPDDQAGYQSSGYYPPEQTPPTGDQYEPRPLEPFADNLIALEKLAEAASGRDALNNIPEGLRFYMPTPPSKHEQLQDRHHPVVHQVTRMLMRDGKLSQAQKHVSFVLNYLRTSPAPKISPLRPLVPGSPPPEQLPLNPLLYLTLAIDSVGPIVRLRSLKGLAGGGNALDIPEPINARARRRQAIAWILDIVNKKRSTGSGRKQFASRFGAEIIAIIEGRSAVWDRRQTMHKMCTAARANLSHPSLSSKRRKM